MVIKLALGVWGGIFVLVYGVLGVVALIMAPVAAYIAHVVWWINLCMTAQMDTAGEITLAILGTVIFPIGMIHGFILWF